MRAVRPALLVLFLAAAPALAADARVAFFIKQLETSKDVRARVQAAAGLGALGDPSAVPALCKAVSDPEDLVKASAAKSLDTIGDISAISCLKAASKPGSAAAAIASALKSLEAAKSTPPRIYVALMPPENKAGLSADDVALLNEQLKARLMRMGAVFAPADETKTAAAKVLKQKKLPGALVMPTVEKYEAGLSLTLVGMTYPDRSLKGQITVKAKAGKPADIIRALVPKALEDAPTEFEWGE